MQRIKFQKKEEDRRCIGAMEGGNCSKLVYTERNNTHDRLTALKKNKKLKKNNDDKFRSRKIHEN